MESYHYIWLSTHTHRDETWLKEKLSEGFDIHHIDGEHNNNNPDNLVLIEHLDHMRLHGLTNTNRLLRKHWSKCSKKKNRKWKKNEPFWSEEDGWLFPLNYRGSRLPEDLEPFKPIA
jgi:hypothetical protein